MKKLLGCMIASIFLLSAVTLTGCTQSSEDENKPEAKVTTISYWGFPNFGEGGSFEKELIAAFEAKNPDIKVKFELIDFTGGPAKIETAIASKTAPDVVYDAPGRIITWANSGILAAIDDVVKPHESNIPAGLLNVSKGADKKLYMYPIHTTPFSTAFNKEMLEDLGVIDLLPYKRGDRSWTLEEYETLLRAIKEKLPKGSTPAVFYCKGQGGDQGTRAFLVNLYGNAPLLTEDYSAYIFNSENAVKNIEWMVKAIKDGILFNGSSMTANDAIDMFAAGKAAHTLLYSPQLNKMRDGQRNYKGKDFTPIYMPFPNSSGKPVLEFIVGGPCVFNNSDPDRIAAAKKFVDFMANDPVWGQKVVNATGAFPANNTVTISVTDPEITYNKTLSAFFGQYYNNIKGFAEMRTHWFPALQAAINGEPVQGTLDTFVEKANKTLK